MCYNDNQSLFEQTLNDFQLRTRKIEFLNLN